MRVNHFFRVFLFRCCCFPRCYGRYLALAFTVIGTLVDLFPEMLLLTEIILHPGVLTNMASVRTILRLMFSDGKPLVVFAASEDEEKPLHPSLLRVRDSLRRRLSSVAASFFMHDGCMGERTPKWTYAGLVGILVGGEVRGFGLCAVEMVAMDHLNCSDLYPLPLAVMQTPLLYLDGRGERVCPLVGPVILCSKVCYRSF